MGKISIHAARDLARRKVHDTMEKTVIHKRQAELALGRWDFVVFGPSHNKEETVLRVGVAEQAVIQNASLYVAALGDPATMGRSGMIPLKELAGGDLSEELADLEIYHVSPLRPLTITEKRKGPELSRMRDLSLKEFSDANLAIIETPDQEAWSLSVLKYLHQCDETLPDPVISEIRNRMSDTSITFNQPGGCLQ